MKTGEWLRTHYVPIDALGIILAGFIGVIALSVGYWQYTAQWQLEHEGRARESYRSFMKISMENPKFSHTNVLGREYTDLEQEQYFWYVSLMSQTFEEIFKFIHDEPEWDWVATEQFRLHCGFFRSNDYNPDFHSEKFRELVEKTIAKVDPKNC